MKREQLTISYDKKRGIVIKGEMTSKHLDDAIRDLVALRMSIAEKKKCARPARTAAMRRKPQQPVGDRVIALAAVVAEKTCTAMVGSVNADVMC